MSYLLKNSGSVKLVHVQVLFDKIQKFEGLSLQKKREKKKTKQLFINETKSEF